MPITRALAAFASRRRTRAPGAAVESSGASAEFGGQRGADAARAATETGLADVRDLVCETIGPWRRRSDHNLFQIISKSQSR